MRVVAAVEFRLDGLSATVHRSTLEQRIEIDHAVELRLRPYPRIHREALRFHVRVPAHHRLGPATRDDGDADDRQPLRVDAIDDLLRIGDDLLGLRAAGNVVGALEEDHVRRACAFQQSRSRRASPVRAVAAGRCDAIARDAFVDDAPRLASRERREPCGKHVRPPLIAIGNDRVAFVRAAATIRDRIAEGDDDAWRGRHDVDFCEPVEGIARRVAPRPAARP